MYLYSECNFLLSKKDLFSLGKTIFLKIGFVFTRCRVSCVSMSFYKHPKRYRCVINHKCKRECEVECLCRAVVVSSIHVCVCANLSC